MSDAPQSEDPSGVVRLSRIRPPAPVVLTGKHEEKILKPSPVSEHVGIARDAERSEVYQESSGVSAVSIERDTKKPRRTRISKKVLHGTLFIAVLLGAGVTLKSYVDFYTESVSTSKLSEVEVLLKSVGALVTLPQDEAPIVATVTDPTLLAQGLTSAFFRDALPGDKVIEYRRNGLAILYRPSKLRIIRVFDRNLASDIFTKSELRNLNPLQSNEPTNDLNAIGTVTTVPPLRH